MRYADFILSKLRAYWILFLYPVFILILLPDNLSGRRQMMLLIYALSLFFVFYLAVKNPSPTVLTPTPTREYKQYFIGLLIFSLILIFITRLIPFLRFGEAPLGYDTGFYIQDIIKMKSSIIAAKGVYPEKLFTFIFIPFNALGLSPNYALSFVYFLIQFLFAGSLYFLFNSLKFKNHFQYASAAVFIFAISLTQFYAYWAMFPKQLLALSAFLFSIGLILRKSYLTIFIAIFGALMNIPAFAMFISGLGLFTLVKGAKTIGQKIRLYPQWFLFGILTFGLLFFFLLTKINIWPNHSSDTYIFLLKRGLNLGRWFIFLPLLVGGLQFLSKRKIVTNKILVAGFAFFAIWNIFYWGQDYRSITEVIDYLVKYKGLATNFPDWMRGEIKGNFINISVFRDMNFNLLPFVLFTLFQPSLWRVSDDVRMINRNFLIFIYSIFLVILVLVVFPFIYQYRFVIAFDLFFIIFAVPAFLLLTNYHLDNKFGMAAITVFILIFSFIAVYYALIRQPQLYPAELAELKNFGKTAEKNALILATDSFYTPWVQGFSGRAGQGPGYGGNTWGLANWIHFWAGADDNIRYQLLDIYEQPLYLFLGQRQPTGQKFQQFLKESKRLQQISPHIWKYDKKHEQNPL